MESRLPTLRQDQCRTTSNAESSVRLPCIAPCEHPSNMTRSRTTITTRRSFLQKKVKPAKWALTMSQLKDFIARSRFTERYLALKRAKAQVNLYDLNESFVKPQTRGIGSSLALLWNVAEPLTAELMISHAWGEDVEELEDALIRSHCVVADSTCVWFCLLSVYQPGDEAGDVGPTIQEQLDRKPFQKVIKSLRQQNPGDVGIVRMIVVHTTAEEVYSRLWCVHEIDEALSACLVVKGVCSMEYASRCVVRNGCYGHINDSDITVSTAEAACSRLEDERCLRALILGKGTFEQLDEVVRAFRRDMVKQFLGELHVRPVTPLDSTAANSPSIRKGDTSPNGSPRHNDELRRRSQLLSPVSSGSSSRRPSNSSLTSGNRTPGRANCMAYKDQEASNSGGSGPCSRSTSLTSLIEDERGNGESTSQRVKRSAVISGDLTPRKLRSSPRLARLAPSERVGPIQRSLSDTGYVVNSAADCIGVPADLIVQRGLPPAEAMLKNRRRRACSPDLLFPSSPNMQRQVTVKEVQDPEKMVWQAISKLEREGDAAGE